MSDMKRIYRIIIWGLGDEFRSYCTIIRSDDILNAKKMNQHIIVAYCDQDEDVCNKIEKRIGQIVLNPDDALKIPHDLIVTSCRLKEIIQRKCPDTEVLSFYEYLEKRIIVPKRAVGNGQSMHKYVKKMLKEANINIMNVFEIGSNYGQDAEYLRLCFGLERDKVYTFEANKKIYSESKEYYGWSNSYNVAILDRNGAIDFHVVPDEEPNSGISTAANYSYTRDYDVERVKCQTMHDFLKAHKEVEEISFCKIDVEGFSYEVLKGFKNKIDIVDCFQIEGDHNRYFENQHLFSEVALYLYQHNYELIMYELHEYNNQSDSLWIKKELLRNIPAGDNKYI